MELVQSASRARRICAAFAMCACAAFGVGAAGQSTATTAATSKLTTVLADFARSAAVQSGRFSPRAADTLPKSVQDALRSRRLRIDDSGAAQVYVLVTDVNDGVLKQLSSAGATIELSDAAHRRVQARIPASALSAVAQLPVVREIRLPTYARHRTGSVTTEGDAIIGALATRNDWGLDGTGVRVGVLSDGLKGVFAAGCTSCSGVANGPISKGDLPTATGIRNASGVLLSSTGGIVARSFQANGDLEGLPPASPVCGFAGAGAEGTALLEIVHDVAPGAKLSFANADTDMAFAQAVNFLAASNDVVVDDIGFYGEPYDGTSAVSANTAAALNNPANPLRAYFTAVGNDADEHYYGAYADSGVDGASISGIGTPGHLHLFQATGDTTDVLGLGAEPYNLISLPANGEVAIFLTWDDPFGAAADNYDLYLVQDSTGRVVARSTDVQSGSQDPVETIDYVNDTGAQARFRIVVQNVQNAAKPRNLDIFSFQPECAPGGPQLLAPPRHERHNYNTAARSVAAQGDAGGSPASVVSVGAICSASAAAAQGSGAAPDESCLDTSNSTIEFFSSRGPTLDGRPKPDLAAIDGVSVTGAGSFDSPFFGTSAAAPHAAGAAALFLQAAPCLLTRAGSNIDPAAARAAVRNAILGRATPMSDVRPDDVFGAGLVDIHAAVQASFPVAPQNRTLTFDANSPFGATLTASQLGYSDPDNCTLTQLNWTGGCGTGPAASMTCPFGASSVSVRAANNTVAYSEADDFQITVTTFSIAVSPSTASVTAGTSATFTVTLAAQNGPFNSPVTLSCSNLPAQASCTFSPPVVTPGAGTAQSMLTITTAGATSVVNRKKAGPTAPTPRRPIDPDAALDGAAVVLMVLWFFALARWRRSAGRPFASAVAAATSLALIATSAAAPSAASAMVSGIAVFPASASFGTQTVGTAAPPVLVSITNIGADPLTITSISASAPDFVVTSACGTTVSAGASCGVAVGFAPTATGLRSGTLTIADDAAGSPHTVALSGTGQAAPSASGPTPSGTYAVTVSGTSNTLVQSAAAVLTVQ